MRRILLVLGYLWSAPLGLVGLFAALLFWAIGWGRPALWRDKATTGKLTVRTLGWFWVVEARGWLARRLAARGWAAFTLGWTIFVWRELPGGDDDDALLAHESEHVCQALRWGLLFWPAYLSCWAALSVWYTAKGVDFPEDPFRLAYHRNPFEVGARRAAGQDA
jgi:hypothetical protein